MHDVLCGIIIISRGVYPPKGHDAFPQDDRMPPPQFLANVNALYVVVRSSVCLSVICLSVTFVHPTQAIEIFGNVSTPFNTLAI